MQTIFRLPWSTEPSSDKALAEKQALYQQSRQKPSIDFPLLNTSKRKRTDSVDASPNSAPQVKRILKCADVGAVQPALEPVRGADSHPSLAPAVAGAQSDDAIKSMETAVQNCPVSQGGNTPSGEMKEERRALSPTAAAFTTPAVAGTESSVLLTESLHQTAAAPPHAIAADKSINMAKAKPDLQKLRAIIEAQINLEVLHKHHELRLIEQELAKCQVGLEQLRRCEVIPYPGVEGPSQAVSSGTGPALASPSGYTSPQYASPWGVADGPYSRHYAKWLIPHPSFDNMIAHASVGTPLSARGIRATRGSGAEPLLPASTARHSRTSTGSRTSGDPNTPAPTRDPMIMKRQQDGEWVRLRCNHCGRANFNNIQGFLNHCRIAHTQEFKSHEAAAITCGEIVSVDEAHYPVDPAPVARESARSSVVTFTTEQPLVSPLISNPPAYSPLDRVLTHPYTPEATPHASPTTTTPIAGPSRLGMTPHLSSLMQRRGMSTAGLAGTVRENKKRVDLSVYDDSSSDRENHNSKRSRTKKPKAAIRHPSSGQYSLPTSSKLGPRPSSQKGNRAPLPAFSAQPFETGLGTPLPPLDMVAHSSCAFGNSIAESPKSDVDMDLSPGTAADSNPGLVSDHEDDYDDADEDARSAHGSQPEMIDGIAVEIEDASDVERDGRKRVRVVDGEGEPTVCRRDTAVELSESSG
jgi:ADA HAT complex component 1